MSRCAPVRCASTATPKGRSLSPRRYGRPWSRRASASPRSPEYMITATAAGDAALLFDTDRPPAWLAAAIEAADLPGVRDVVPGARTVLVIIEPGSAVLDELAARVAALPIAQPAAGETRLVELPVIYDGPDLADVAGLYEVGWLGFAPGFGYLTGLDQRLAGVPRLVTPRLAVPAGSVAIAAGLTAVYPSDSPGGW